ncbi:hypothetical protein T10_7062 [Trichinella papuae]|uniref:Uncharacterized protein n=1 Tax=Trichinella papuae TaxID=268474 RepID=A0A0V1MFB8_9BILA|nr:hypothetical protein T10_7062 [Trichinella papuae]
MKEKICCGSVRTNSFHFSSSVDQSRLFSALGLHFGTLQIKCQHGYNNCGKDQSARLIGNGIELCKRGYQDRGLDQQGAGEQRRTTDCRKQQRPGACDQCPPDDGTVAAQSSRLWRLGVAGEQSTADAHLHRAGERLENCQQAEQFQNCAGKLTGTVWDEAPLGSQGFQRAQKQEKADRQFEQSDQKKRHVHGQVGAGHSTGNYSHTGR